jgi:hypothetical protein
MAPKSNEEHRNRSANPCAKILEVELAKFKPDFSSIALLFLIAWS